MAGALMFGGLTPDEAAAKFRECPMTYQEDFMFMGPKAFTFYFPAIETFLFDTKAEEADEYDDRQAWILSHCIQNQLAAGGSEVAHLTPRFLALSRFVRENVAWFTTDTGEQQRIRSAWQDVDESVKAIS
jgi:hypothetical protein